VTVFLRHVVLLLLLLLLYSVYSINNNTNISSTAQYGRHFMNSAVLSPLFHWPRQRSTDRLQCGIALISCVQHLVPVTQTALRLCR